MSYQRAAFGGARLAVVPKIGTSHYSNLPKARAQRSGARWKKPQGLKPQKLLQLSCRAEALLHPFIDQALEEAALICSFGSLAGGFLNASASGGRSISRSSSSTISLITGEPCSVASRNCLGSKSVFFRLQAAVCRANSTRPAR